MYRSRSHSNDYTASHRSRPAHHSHHHSHHHNSLSHLGYSTQCPSQSCRRSSLSPGAAQQASQHISPTISRRFTLSRSVGAAEAAIAERETASKILETRRHSLMDRRSPSQTRNHFETIKEVIEHKTRGATSPQEQRHCLSPRASQVMSPTTYRAARLSPTTVSSSAAHGTRNSSSPSASRANILPSISVDTLQKSLSSLTIDSKETSTLLQDWLNSYPATDDSQMPDQISLQSLRSIEETLLHIVCEGVDRHLQGKDADRMQDAMNILYACGSRTSKSSHEVDELAFLKELKSIHYVQSSRVFNGGSDACHEFCTCQNGVLPDLLNHLLQVIPTALPRFVENLVLAIQSGLKDDAHAFKGKMQEHLARGKYNFFSTYAKPIIDELQTHLAMQYIITSWLHVVHNLHRIYAQAQKTKITRQSILKKFQGASESGKFEFFSSENIETLTKLRVMLNVESGKCAASHNIYRGSGPSIREV